MTLLTTPDPHTTPSGGRLTTHVLDTVHGAPAAGMAIALFVRDDASGGTGSPTWRLLREVVTNADGRVDGPMLAGADLRPGVYRLVFEVERYFRAKGVALPTPAFLSQVPLEFGLADAQAHYHVPLLVSPWAYSTYRGS
ncbi:MAG: hydroxyisourate hydrolase [Aquabacterium sp.]|jgi:5-hydroxyisourate hydrolase|uniref:hydroxyisourate hydrolase n=1 Tax=Aquabacterium sp. TaxID=1872578 RepID=UPI002A359BD4|nr:hydroxyisourate hydrolase [Aquabacterium sp.]MDX9844387.1 hydroxyisourate hydrolase [Aquabacterium sp.]